LKRKRGRGEKKKKKGKNGIQRRALVVVYLGDNNDNSLTEGDRLEKEGKVGMVFLKIPRVSGKGGGL